MLDETLDRCGTALLIDCHSMPPSDGIAPVVVGDAFGRSAARWVSELALEVASDHGFAGALNEPFAGGHVVERHGRPSSGVHAIQLEVDRSFYLDDALAEPGPGFDRVATFIDAMVETLGRALLERGFAEAAE